jgi:hypothetical protein
MYRQGAMEVAWCADVDVTAVLFLHNAEHSFPQHCQWLRRVNSGKRPAPANKSATAAKSGDDEGVVRFQSFFVPNMEGDEDNEDNWQALLDLLPGILVFVRSVMRVLCYAVLCCCISCIKF